MKRELYALNGRVLRVDLTSGHISQDSLDEEKLRNYLGGVCLGTRYLYDEVATNAQWFQPENRFFLGAGPLNGTVIGGSGTIAVVTVGAQTGGATESEANGYMGAYLKWCGFDGILIHGAATDWQYLYVHDGTAELRDARHLAGKDTWETEELIKQELGYAEQRMSVFCIGPAGENLVRFAALVGDRGHVAGHNGTGAVLGSKKLKAIAVARGDRRVELKDPDRLRAISREIWEANRTSPSYEWGTSLDFESKHNMGQLPVRNYTTNVFPQWPDFMGPVYRNRYEMTRRPCWACQTKHVNLIRIPDGPYAGFVGEEPEYEQWAACGPAIGVTDVDAAAVLSNDVDRLGMENNEIGWLVGWVMECYEKGLLSRHDLDGLEMNWGNAEATRQLLKNIAHRRGFGSILGEGVMRASEIVGGEAAQLAIYTRKGASPRGHDHRARWCEMFDTTVSNTGTMEVMFVAVRHPEEFGLPEKIDPFDADTIALATAKSKGSMQFEDSMVTCRFVTHMSVPLLCRALEAATGWDLTFDQAMTIGRRAVNLMRVFNLKRGLGRLLEWPSERYGSTPVDGPHAGKSIRPHWDRMLTIYYENMGWDKETGVPLPKTLENLGLSELTGDLAK